MKKQPYLRFARLLFGSAFIVFFLSGPLQGEIIDKVVGIVNKDVITLSGLLEIVQSQPPNSDNFNSLKKSRDLLKQIIERKLISQEATRMGIKASDNEVDKAIENFQKGNGITAAQLKEALREQGVIWEEYRENFREEISRQHIINQKIRSQVSVTDKDLEKYYQDHLDDFVEPPKVKIEQLFFSFPPAASAQAKKDALIKAESALKLIRSGENFQKVAEEYGFVKEGASIDLDYFGKGELMTCLDTAAFSLTIGKASDLISTNKGYFIIRVLDRAEEKTKTIDEVREKIYNQLYQQKMEKKYQEWIQELHNKAYIETKI